MGDQLSGNLLFLVLHTTIRSPTSLVTPAKAGNQVVLLDSRLHGNDVLSCENVSGRNWCVAHSRVKRKSQADAPCMMV